MNREILELNDAINLMELTDAYTVFYPTMAQYTSFLTANEIFFKINHTLGHKASLNKCKKMKITPCKMSKPNAINSITKKQQKIHKQLLNHQ
jgi:predicted Zn-dependent protease